MGAQSDARDDIGKVSGRGSGARRGRWGGAARGRRKEHDDYDWRADDGQELDVKAPLPGGFKSMKSRWLSDYEREQKERESSAQSKGSQATAHARAWEQQRGMAQAVAQDQSCREQANDGAASAAAAAHRPASARSVRQEPSSSRLARANRLAVPEQEAGYGGDEADTTQGGTASAVGDTSPAAARAAALAGSAQAEEPVLAQHKPAPGAEAAAGPVRVGSDAGDCGGVQGAGWLADAVRESPAGGPTGDMERRAGIVNMPKGPKRGHAAAAARQADTAQAAVKKTKPGREPDAPALAGAAANQQQPGAAGGSSALQTHTSSQGPGQRDSGAALPAGMGHSSPQAAAERHAASSGQQGCGVASAGGAQRQVGLQGQAFHGLMKEEAAAHGVKPEQLPGHAGEEREELHQAAALPSGSAWQDSEQVHAKPEAGASAQDAGAKLATVELLSDGCTQARPLGTLNLASFESYMVLWQGLREAYGAALPKQAGLKLVYQDGEGDLLLLQPDLPWAHFLATARRVIIACK